jgi:tetratricopeptide (TPR) repeat protein
LTTLQNARGDFPREQALIIEELNIYLVAGEFERAKENLMLAAEQDPTNEILWFSLGSVYDNLNMQDEAVEAYGKSLGIKPDYFDANYNLGALYFNKAVQMVNDANDMWKPRMSKDESAKQTEMEKGGKAMFSTALPYLEKALEVDPEDRETLRSLRDIYARVGLDDKMLEVSAKLKSME